MTKKHLIIPILNQININVRFKISVCQEAFSPQSALTILIFIVKAFLSSLPLKHAEKISSYDCKQQWKSLKKHLDFIYSRFVTQRT